MVSTAQSKKPSIKKRLQNCLSPLALRFIFLLTNWPTVMKTKLRLSWMYWTTNNAFKDIPLGIGQLYLSSGNIVVQTRTQIFLLSSWMLLKVVLRRRYFLWIRDPSYAFFKIQDPCFIVCCIQFVCQNHSWIAHLQNPSNLFRLSSFLRMNYFEDWRSRFFIFLFRFSI